MIRIRTGEAKDRDYVDDLGRRTLRDNVAAFRTADDDRLEASYAEMVDFAFATGSVLLIADRESRPVGFVLMLDKMPDEVTRTPQGFIAYMAVEPSARRQGVASLLLGAAEEEARRRALPCMGLMVTEDNAAARALYERAGYRTERRLLCKAL